MAWNDLLQPQHPLEKYHQAQLDLLTALPEEMCEEGAQGCRLGKATYRYKQ